MSLKFVRIAVALAAFASGAASAAINLPAYNVDTSNTTVSGLSSGGFMANQLGIAYSSLFKGVGVFAAGPYMCAGLSNYTACMYNASISSSALTNMQTASTPGADRRSTTNPTSPGKRCTCSWAPATPRWARTR